MSEQNGAPAAAETTSSELSPEVADLFGEPTTAPSPTPPPTGDGQPAPTSPASSTSGQEDNKATAAGQSDDDKSKTDNAAKTTTDDKDTKEKDGKTSKKDASQPPKPGEADDPKKTKDGAQPTVYEVAGKQYDSIEKAIEAVNAIAGTNSRLSGEFKTAKQTAAEAQTKLEEQTELLNEAIRLNQAWNEWYKNGAKPTEAPDNTPVDLKKEIVTTLDAREAKKAEAEQKAQFSRELDEIVDNPENANYLEEFEKQIEELPESSRISPKVIFERVKDQVDGRNTKKSLKEIEKEIEDRVRREIAQEQATKVSGNSGGGAAPKQENNLSPEIAELY